MGKWELAKLAKRSLKKNCKSSETKIEDLGVTRVFTSLPVEGRNFGRESRAREQLIIQITPRLVILDYGLLRRDDGLL